MASVSDWLEGARLRTLPASIAPVLAGTGAARELGALSIPRALLALGVALAFQVGVNFANDYSDGLRGTDEVRTGPPRLTGGGLVTPSSVKYAAFASFGVGCIFGLILVALSGDWWLIAAGALAVVAGWYYTGGKVPYGYIGLGEVFVFIFFGLFATLGTTWTQAGQLSTQAWLVAIGIGLIACAVLMINNIRDAPTDARVGKMTLAVRLGNRRARVTYVLFITIPIALSILCAIWSPWCLATAVLLIPWWSLSSRALSGRVGRQLIPVLRDTGFLELAYGAILLFAL